MQSEYSYHPLRHMEPLQIQSALGIHLPMQGEYPYHPLKHMEFPVINPPWLAEEDDLDPNQVSSSNKVS